MLMQERALLQYSILGISFTAFVSVVWRRLDNSCFGSLFRHKKNLPFLAGLKGGVDLACFTTSQALKWDLELSC